MLTLASCLTFVTSCFGKSDKKLVMGFDAEYPPYTYEENGEFVGFDVEYAKKVADELGLKLELKAIDWDGKDEALRTGAIDCIWSGFTYEGRENDYAWTSRYFDNTIVVLTNNKDIKTLADLAGKIVAVQSDSSGEAALSGEDNADLVASFKNGNYQLEGSYTNAFVKLKSGAYEAIVVDVGVAKYLIDSLSDSEKDNYVVLSEAISTETYGVGFRKDDAELANKVSEAMEKVAKDESFVKGLCEKYGIDYNLFILGK